MSKWIEGEKGLLFRRRFSVNDISSIDARLSQYNQYKPKEIHRKIRCLKQLHFWKGTEFRVFLLYTGMVALDGFLPQHEFEHFLKLIIAVIICSSDLYKQYFPKARDLFVEYIDQYINIFGIHSVSSNVHNLSHVVDDIERFGPLSGISSYAFENQLHQLLKQCYKPLEQISRRLTEKFINQTSKKADSGSKAHSCPQVNHSFSLSDAPQLLVFKEISLKQDFTLSDRNRDCWFLCEKNDQYKIVKFEYVIKKENAFSISGMPLKQLDNFFPNHFRLDI